MLKKIIVLTLLIVAGGLFYLSHRTKSNNDQKAYNDLQTPNSTVVFKTDNYAVTNLKNKKIVKVQDHNFEEFDKSEKLWLSEIENILGHNDFDFYLDLRNKNEEEKMSAYKEFHDYLRQKNGDNFSYNISEDQSVREKEINTKNTRELLKRIGEEKFKMYLKARDQFNEQLLRKSQDGSALIIEF